MSSVTGYNKKDALIFYFQASLLFFIQRQFQRNLIYTRLLYNALVTTPSVLRQRAHTLTVLDEPFTTAFIFLIFGFQLLFVLLTECETLCPKVTPLPQNSHFAMIKYLPSEILPKYKRFGICTIDYIISYIAGDCNILFHIFLYFSSAYFKLSCFFDFLNYFVYRFLPYIDVFVDCRNDIQPNVCRRFVTECAEHIAEIIHNPEVVV